MSARNDPIWRDDRHTRRITDGRLLQVEALAHKPLQARLIEKIVGKLFIREHGEAGRLAPAASSEASSTVSVGSWLMTDETIPIMICRRRMRRASSSKVEARGMFGLS
jgi:hypothetical protein